MPNFIRLHLRPLFMSLHLIWFCLTVFIDEDVPVVYSCNSTCPALHFGLNCSSTCNCGEGVQCDPVTGVCPSSASVLPPSCVQKRACHRSSRVRVFMFVCLRVRRQGFGARRRPGPSAPAAPRCALLLLVLRRKFS